MRPDNFFTNIIYSLSLIHIYPKSAGAWYTKRNIYEAEGNYAEAKNCAENEVIAGKGDNKYLPSEYDKRMRMKLIAGK